jgi:NAD(P)-dependent dehydrogenase (short-subunit alcohol dehydrogenase family)
LKSIDGKVAMITGGGSGIGAATAVLLASYGAAVMVTDISADAAAAVAEQIRSQGGRAESLACDIGDEDVIQQAFARTVAEFGKIDIAHNNAALLTAETLRDDIDILTIPTATWDRVMQVTLRGTMLCCRYAILAMLKTAGGSIINTSSMLGVAADNRLPAYSSAKAAINLLTQSVAARYGRQGIRCNAVAPSIILTPLIERAMPPELIKIHAESAMTPFLGEPTDVANAVAWLASDESRYITGQIIRVDGGSTATVPMHAGQRLFFGDE